MGVKFGTEELIVAPMGVKFDSEAPPCQISPPSVQRVTTEKPQNRPLSKLNNQRFALRAVLSVNKYV